MSLLLSQLVFYFVIAQGVLWRYGQWLLVQPFICRLADLPVRRSSIFQWVGNWIGRWVYRFRIFHVDGIQSTVFETLVNLFSLLVADVGCYKECMIIFKSRRAGIFLSLHRAYCYSWSYILWYEVSLPEISSCYLRADISSEAFECFRKLCLGFSGRYLVSQMYCHFFLMLWFEFQRRSEVLGCRYLEVDLSGIWRVSWGLTLLDSLTYISCKFCYHRNHWDW